MPIPIEKEHVSALHFPSADVLIDAEQKKERHLRLTRALKLGNNSRRKVKILFEDIEGIKRIEATVWALTEKNVAIKGGRMIPIHRIHEVKYF